MDGQRRSSRTVWIVAGLVVLGLILVLAGPLSDVGNNGRTEALFAEPPDTESLEALGSFQDPAEVAADGPAASADEEADAAQAVAAADVESAAAAVDPAGEVDPAGGGGAAATAPDASPAGVTETDSTDSTIGSGVSNFSGGDIFGLIWRLALVAAIIWGSIFVLRKYVGHSARAKSDSGALKVLETVGLASNRLVYLLEAGDRVLVVGTTPNHIALLAELDDAEVVSALRSDADRTSPTVATLGSMMRGVGSRLGFMRLDPTRNEDGAERAARRGAQPAPSSLLTQLREAEREIAASARRLKTTADDAAAEASSAGKTETPPGEAEHA